MKKGSKLGKVVNVASVPHRSLFRYPGGKTWLVPRIRTWLSTIDRPSEFIEPFAGGAIVSLSVMFENLADRITLIEIDPNVAAVWRVLVSGKGPELSKRIREFTVSEDEVRSYLDATHRTIVDKAFATILRNRMQRGGIMASGASLMRNGENGKGLMSRWYPETLQTRISGIHERRSRMSFKQEDGIDYLRQQSKRTDAVFFIDPPYTVAGSRLYNFSVVDDDLLFHTASGLRGDFLMTYDNVDEIRCLAKKYNFDTQEVPMKNTHHAVMSELLIGRNLDWARR